MHRLGTYPPLYTIHDQPSRRSPRSVSYLTRDHEILSCCSNIETQSTIASKTQMLTLCHCVQRIPLFASAPPCLSTHSSPHPRISIAEKMPCQTGTRLPNPIRSQDPIVISPRIPASHAPLAPSPSPSPTQLPCPLLPNSPCIPTQLRTRVRNLPAQLPRRSFL